MSVRKDAYVWVGVAIIVAAVVLVAFSFLKSYYTTTTVRLGDGVFHAKIAATDDARAKGLGGVTELSEQQAMLFTYEQDEVVKIWMKDMNIPIDVVWLDASKKVVYVKSSLQPSSYPSTYGPSIPVRYVLEFADGTIAKKAIKVGLQASFTIHGEGQEL